VVGLPPVAFGLTSGYFVCGISLQMLHYVPKGRRSQGRLPKRWQETVTGH
jgi:hypothetical protein